MGILFSQKHTSNSHEVRTCCRYRFGSRQRQNQQLAATKAQITEQLANFYESEGVVNAKNKAREVSQKIVSIYNDSTLTITQKANKVKEAIASKVGNVNKQKLNQVFNNVIAQTQAIYQPWVEQGQKWLNDARGSWNSLL